MMPQSLDTVCNIRTDVFRKYNAEASVSNGETEDTIYTLFCSTDLMWGLFMSQSK